MPIARDSGTSNKDAVDLDSLDLKYLEEGRVPDPLHEALTAARPRERVGRGGGVHDANVGFAYTKNNLQHMFSLARRSPSPLILVCFADDLERMAQKQDNRDTVFRVTNSWPSATTRNFLLLSELFHTDFPAFSALRGTIRPRSTPYSGCDKWHRGLKAVEEKIWNAWMEHEQDQKRERKKRKTHQSILFAVPLFPGTIYTTVVLSTSHKPNIRTTARSNEDAVHAPALSENVRPPQMSVCEENESKDPFGERAGRACQARVGSWVDC
ncbi:hypothetical protein K438DRAFT_1986444 [Mycena galopus ATCC 62051]|nr:hypothetical protein K438DRAFT_1986444 [Mycena galopus ATCC 62051]